MSRSANGSSFKNTMALDSAVLVHRSPNPEEAYAGTVTPFLTAIRRHPSMVMCDKSKSATC
jgi:hypothetical protein